MYSFSHLTHLFITCLLCAREDSGELNAPGPPVHGAYIKLSNE